MAPLADVTNVDIESRYEFIEELGQGTTSQVYLASNCETGLDAAIKVFTFDEEIEDEDFEIIQAEVTVLRLVRHLCVVKLTVQVGT